MFRLYLTRLILPLLFVTALLAAPFFWLPEVGSPPVKPVKSASRAESASGEKPDSRDEKPGRAKTSPFQKVMTVGFAMILISVTAGGIMLYRIVRLQSGSWQRRFATPKKSEDLQGPQSSADRIARLKPQNKPRQK